MAVKAQLSVQLLADGVLVAESDDQQLWSSVFAAIQKGHLSAGSAPLDAVETSPGAVVKQRANGAVQGFALELGITEEELVGACSPEAEAPYIRLDQRYWEALKKKTGSRGLDAIAPVTLAATLLAIWFKHCQIKTSPTIKQCQDVLATINARDQNAARSLNNSEWLQTRNGGVQINPAQWSQAVRVAKAYCLQKSPKELMAASNQ